MRVRVCVRACARAHLKLCTYLDVNLIYRVVSVPSVTLLLAGIAMGTSDSFLVKPKP